MTELPIHSPLGTDATAGSAPVYFTARTSSTMDDARRLVRQGAPSGTVVVTDFQTAGRGRRAGREWVSPPRESLMFTVALYEPEDPVTRSLVMAVAVSRMLEQQFSLDVAVKWPNDVLVRGRKICGILADHEGWLYLGVGLNLWQTGFPAELAGTATSVAIETRSRPQRHTEALSDRDGLLCTVLELYRDVEPEWHALLSRRLWMAGEEVEVAVPYGPTLCGRLAGIADDGCLLVDTGRLHRIAAGEVSLTRGIRS